MYFFLIDGNGVRLVVHPIVLFDGGSGDHPVVLSLRSEGMAATAIFRDVVSDVGYNGPVGM